MKKIIKDMKNEERGAISTLVLFTVLIFVIILMGAYMIVTTNQKSQLKSDMRIKDIYAEDVERVDEIYNELTKYAKYDEPYIPKGFTHIEGTWNNGYVIKETSTGNEFVWVPCVVDQTKVKEGDTVVTFQKTTAEKYNLNNLGLLPTDTSVTPEDASTKELELSVEKYGGFYIAKYEAGIEESIDNYSLTIRKVTDGSIKPLSQPDKGVWNQISREEAILVSKAMIDEEKTGVKSGLISGTAWDTTLQWIVKTSDNAINEPNVDYDIDSEGKGWYNDVSNNAIHTTGYFAVNNIYDMAGNIWEYTTENCTSEGNNHVVSRGATFYNAGLWNPAAYRFNSEGVANRDFGFRIVLYKIN